MWSQQCVEKCSNSVQKEKATSYIRKLPVGMCQLDLREGGKKKLSGL